MARRSKINDEHVRQALVDAAADGLTRSLMAGAVRITPTTLSRWLARGRDECDRADETGDESHITAYGTLWREIAHTEAEYARSLIRDVRNGVNVRGLPDWNAPARILERRYLNDYGATRTEVTGRDGGPLSIIDAAMRDGKQDEVERLEREAVEHHGSLDEATEEDETA